MLQLLVISERAEDLEFGQKVAKNAQLNFNSETDPAKISIFLQDHDQTLIFWDVDYPGAEVSHRQNSAAAIAKRISQSRVKPSHVFGLASTPISKLDYLKSVRVLAHQVLRQYNEVGAQILGSIARACFSESPFGAIQYSPPETVIQKLVLKDSKQRPPAVAAIESIFLKKQLHPQLCSLVAQSADELLMNAIFDAPLDSKQFPYRRATIRNEAFPLSEKEQVTLEFTQTNDYLIVCVGDNFGSLPIEVATDFLKKDYEDQSYKLDRKTKSSGLGVYGMMQMGESLLFVCKPGIRTEVFIFIPTVRTMREFRSGFCFFGHIFV